MNKTHIQSNHLSAYVDSLQKQGRITFRLDEVALALGANLQKMRLAAYRLSQSHF